MDETLISWVALVVSVAALGVSSLRWHVARQVARDAKEARRQDREARKAQLRRELYENTQEPSFEPYRYIRQEGHHSQHLLVADARAAGVAEEDIEALIEHAKTVRTVWLLLPEGDDPKWTEHLEKEELARREFRRILLGDKA